LRLFNRQYHSNNEYWLLLSPRIPVLKRLRPSLK
jgi:hypothetical protein